MQNREAGSVALVQEAVDKAAPTDVKAGGPKVRKSSSASDMVTYRNRGKEEQSVTISDDAGTGASTAVSEGGNELVD